MHSGNYAMYRNDPGLTALQDFDESTLRSALQQAMAQSLPDVDPCAYSVENLRYTPGTKLVLGLTTPTSNRTIAVRIFANGNLNTRLRRARERNGRNVVALPAINALAWVFPAERKLNFELTADAHRFNVELRQNFGFNVRGIELVRYVPEHACTYRVDGTFERESTFATVYAKLTHGASGPRAACAIERLRGTLPPGLIRVPDQSRFVATHNLLLQTALSGRLARASTDAEIARALATLHACRPWQTLPLAADPADAMKETDVLLEHTFPRYRGRVQRLWARIEKHLGMCSDQAVVTHGDVHLGNLFPLQDGTTAMIDVDACTLAPPQDDLAAFFGFRIWLAIRAGKPLTPLLQSLDDFVETYNASGPTRTTRTRVLISLAEKMLTQRVRRGIARCKLAGEDELEKFVDTAEWALMTAERTA